MNSPFSSVARWWRNRGIVRGNLEREALVVQPELRALAGKWPDAALKRRLAAFEPDQDVQFRRSSRSLPSSPNAN